MRLPSNRGLLVGFTIAACLLFAACDTSPADPVATYTNGALTAGEVSARLVLEPIHVQKKFNSSAEEKRAYVESMVGAELMQREARRRKIDQEPRIRAQIQRILVRELERQLEDEAGQTATQPEEIDKAYEAERSRFELPRMVRASVLVLRTKDEAASIRQSLLDNGQSARRIEELRRTHGVTGARQGDRGYIHEKSKHVAEAIRGAALAMTKDGEISRPLQTPQGWALVLRTGERAAVTRTLDQLRPMLETRLRIKRGRAAVAEAKQQLRAAADLAIDDQALQGLQAPEKVAVPARGGKR